MVKIDPYKHKERYEKWKIKFEKGISGITPLNSDLIMNYLLDMEKGINIATGSAKGRRSYSRLNTVKDRLIYFSKIFKEKYAVESMVDINENQLLGFFADMRSGIIKTNLGKIYKSVDTYANIYKALWHWHMKVQKKEGIELKDITSDLDTSREKPKWVYLTEKQVRNLCSNATFEQRVLMMFLYDTGIRAPTELLNIKISDFYNDFQELNIREETSKTFGRRIKLMFCKDLVREYVVSMNFEKEDYLFDFKPYNVNRNFQRLAKKVLGEGISEAGEAYHKITMYDFRHCSCCYWLPRYKSEAALKYRFGWKKSDKIHYYSELLGMRDTISEEDLLIEVTKTEIEKRLTNAENKNKIILEENEQIKKQMKQILMMVKGAREVIVSEI